MITLGEEVKDKVSGFKGIATSRVEYLNGCIQYGVTPKVEKHNKKVDTCYIDEDQLVVVSTGVNTKKKEKPPGGYREDQPNR